MKSRKFGWLGPALMAVLCLGPVLVEAQFKPPDSAGKIKKVLLYNKVGENYYVNDIGITQVKSAFTWLAETKGFELVQLIDDAGMTLEYLKQFQVIVWNNNGGGIKTVPSATARQAVLDYLDQGGGWMLISLAAEHGYTWPEQAKIMGTSFAGHTRNDRAEVVMDEDAKAHGELKWMVQDFPEFFELTDYWLGFHRTVRPLPGVTVVATVREIPGIPNVIYPPRDSSGDYAYTWAREVGQGRFLYTGIGFGRSNLMQQHDGIVPGLYWENIRYLAGDYQNGCTSPGSPGFDPAARVHVEALCTASGLATKPKLPDMVASQAGRRIRLTRAFSGPFTIRIRDIRGVNVWERTLPGGTSEVALDDALQAGVYHLEVSGLAYATRQRLFLP